MGNDFFKLIIDSGSSVNAISERALKKLGLPCEKHPNPYEVSWVINSSLPVNNRCLLTIKILSYEDQVWLDVVPMDICSIILGRRGYMITMLEFMEELMSVPLCLRTKG